MKDSFFPLYHFIELKLFCLLHVLELDLNFWKEHVIHYLDVEMQDCHLLHHVKGIWVFAVSISSIVEEFHLLQLCILEILIHFLNHVILLLEKQTPVFASLTQPIRGICNDFLQLSLGESYLPKICGDNTGQHVYVDFLPNCDDQTLSFKFLNTPSTRKRWNIKITQIPCNSPLAAPRGCLQYYTSLMGTVSSFNYGSQAINVLRQLSPLNYTVCVLPQYGYCSIKWSNASATNFRLQNATLADGALVAVCESNYVSILNPDCAPAECPARNRFCGDSFTGAISSARIFELQVVNNYQDAQIDGDVGFSLSYQQRVCN